MMHHDRYCYIPISEEQELESLQEKLCFLQAFLEDYYSPNGGETVHSLEQQIRDVAYQAQDIIESHISNQIRSDYDCCGVKRGFRQLVSAIPTVGPPLNPGERYLELRRRDFGKRYEDLLKVLEQIDSIVEEVINIQRCCRVEDLKLSYTSAPASSRLEPNGRNKMVGFEEDLMLIKDRLCGQSSKLGIISIVGMGGMGKTTLARNIFDDSLVAYYFHTRAWITVSQDYHLREILLGLLDSFTVIIEDLSKKTDEELVEYVYKCLKGRTYLIIMDDMWSIKAWDDLKRAFPDDYNGSRVVITTRLSDVALCASSSPIHQMHFLDEDQSWNLLRERVFAQQSCPPRLEKIGRIIAKNCGGLPLALAVVAGILAKVGRTQNHWKNVAENISLAVTTNDEHFSKILTLSYDHLPYHLKACFLYMGGFREDYEIPVSNLIKLWVAEGFLKSIGSKSLEEVAEECLEDLVKRNLVMISKKRSNGKFRFCVMHDLLRDLCIRKAEVEKFLHVVDRSDYTYARGVKNQRRLSIRPNISGGFFLTKTSASPIRSILNFCYYMGSYSFVLSFRLLRVLDTQGVISESLLVEITDLFHLRYLAFSYSSFRHKLLLPPSICKLHNLQTLIIRSNINRETLFLPFQIWKMPQLRHLILFNKSDLPITLAARIGWQVPVLENLQTLSRVTNFRLTSKALEMIPNLKKLRVLYTGVSRAKWAKYCLNNLVHLRQLETLNFSFHPTPRWKRDLLSLRALLYHPSLRS
ncbi:hypothetical protein Pfo_020302 [Paulownia fortunei]|nr:hypothetical protein Pfo_020302 [Paulownia fortunei]